MRDQLGHVDVAFTHAILQNLVPRRRPANGRVGAVRHVLDSGVSGLCATEPAGGWSGRLHDLGHQVVGGLDATHHAVERRCLFVLHIVRNRLCALTQHLLFNLGRPLSSGCCRRWLPSPAKTDAEPCLAQPPDPTSLSYPPLVTPCAPRRRPQGAVAGAVPTASQPPRPPAAGPLRFSPLACTPRLGPAPYAAPAAPGRHPAHPAEPARRQPTAGEAGSGAGLSPPANACSRLASHQTTLPNLGGPVERGADRRPVCDFLWHPEPRPASACNGSSRQRGRCPSSAASARKARVCVAHACSLH
eukprot:scaffold1272_cov250-Pinguiococcus_pyrenoidosus.AAC.60